MKASSRLGKFFAVLKGPPGSKRRWAYLGVIVLGIVSIWIFNRNFHFHFDDHHRHDDDANFLHWCAGWFKDWGRGPLGASLIEGPKTGNDNPLTESQYRWFLKKYERDSEILFFSDDYQNLPIGLAWIPAKREFIVYRPAGGSTNTLHMSNDWANSITPGDRVDVERSALYWIAWAPTRWEWKKSTWSSIRLGDNGIVPPGHQLQEWAFIIEVQQHNRDAEVVLGFDRDRQEWRIFDREYREQLDINSWLDHVGKL